MNEYRHTTTDLAAMFGLAPKTIRKKAARLRLGIDLEGRAGFRYSDADIAKLKESMRPTSAPAPRRRRRVA